MSLVSKYAELSLVSLAGMRVIPAFVEFLFGPNKRKIW